MLSLDNFITHAKRVIRTADKERKALHGIKYNEDGSAMVTDGKRLYRVSDIHNKGDKLLTPSGRKLNETYPAGFHRIIPEGYPTQEGTVSVADLKYIADTVDSVTRVAKEPRILTFIKNRVVYESKELTIAIDTDYDIEVPITLNARFLYEALQLFEDAGCENINMKIFNSRNSVLFTGNNVQVLILIIREE